MSLGNEGVPFTMPVEPVGTSNNGNGGWGGDWGAWIILFLIFGMFGWGGMGGFGGFGGFGGMGGAYPVESILQRSLDTQTIIGKLDGVNQGLCDGFYAQNNAINGLGMSMMQGLHGVDNAICNQGYATQQGFNAMQAAMMQGNNTLQAQLAQCCCDNRVGQMQIQNQMGADTCTIQNTIQNTTRDTIDNQNANARAILDALTAQRMEAKDQRIAEQAQTIAQLQLSASQQAQNAVLMAAMDANKADILRRTGNDCPVSAYIVQPPTPVNFPTNCCGTFSGNGWGGNGCGCC